MVNKNPFLVGLNFIEPVNEFNVNIDVLCYYKYEDPLDAPFFLGAYLLQGESYSNFTERLQVEGGIIKMCLHCEKYYGELKVMYNKHSWDWFKLEIQKMIHLHIEAFKIAKKGG